MIDSKKKHFTDTIFLFIKEITNPKTIHNMMCRPDIIQDIKDGNINKIAQKIIQKILDNIDLDIDITKLTEIFIHSPSNISETTNIQNNKNQINKHSKKNLLSYYILERFGGWVKGNKLDFLFEWSGMFDVFIKIYILLLQKNFSACEYGLPSSWNA